MSVRARLDTDKCFTQIAVDVLAGHRDLYINPPHSIDNRFIGIVIVIHPDTGMILANHKAVAAVIFCHNSIQNNFVTAGKNIAVLQRYDDNPTVGKVIFNEKLEAIITKFIAKICAVVRF